MTMRAIPGSSTWPTLILGRGRRAAPAPVARAAFERRRRSLRAAAGFGNLSTCARTSSMSRSSLLDITLRGCAASLPPFYADTAAAGRPAHRQPLVTGRGVGNNRRNSSLETLMDWREEYKRRLTSAEDAVAIVERGDLVVIPIAGPRVLPRALFRHGQEVGPIDLRLSSPLSDPGWLQADWQELFRLEFEVFIGDFARPAMDEDRGTSLPNLFSLGPKPIDDGRPAAAR